MAGDSQMTARADVDLEAATEELAKDVFRDTPLRLAGYANEVGEAFRPIFPRWVLPSYCAAFGYVFADTADKGLKLGTFAAADTLVWQTFASVLLPGMIINRVVWAASHAYSSPALVSRVSPSVLRFAPVMTGLAAIPFIVEPIDNFVHAAMDKTFRIAVAGFRSEEPSEGKEQSS
ncbi:Mitochondrial fission process protein 1 [Hondaea fermentalgiana]|uniref:Mitochondrial fission process protein 1 n=1 Tax=Hondaea fermentalgiana TaxID=2315210 RepID=A0A2R5GGD0_9STRA|nr:Mitochondrial fission process protein 1 [Hondaea fermentalgiana]|eukprot:GBG29966.1 Mitochondrial fission process protein 1 [Hondaea fermentalgiana]